MWIFAFVGLFIIIIGIIFIKGNGEIKKEEIKQGKIETKDRVEIIAQEKNTLSTVLEIITIITVVIGFIFGLVVGVNNNYDSESGFLIIWLIFGGSALGIYALAEIIQILHDIRRKLYQNDKK